jgi:hypothetical protein
MTAAQLQVVADALRELKELREERQSMVGPQFFIEQLKEQLDITMARKYVVGKHQNGASQQIKVLVPKGIAEFIVSKVTGLGLKGKGMTRRGIVDSPSALDAVFGQGWDTMRLSDALHHVDEKSIKVEVKAPPKATSRTRGARLSKAHAVTFKFKRSAAPTTAVAPRDFPPAQRDPEVLARDEALIAPAPMSDAELALAMEFVAALTAEKQ